MKGEDSDMAAASVHMWGRVGLNKEKNGLCQFLRPEESHISRRCPKPDNSLPHHMSLPPFQLLSQCWNSKRVILLVDKSVCNPFKRSACECSCPLFHSVTICWLSQPEIMGTSLPGNGTLGWGGAGICCSSGDWGEPSQPKYPS
ncbi:hypothetical protein mRhiFer1_010067 [Rhinolophus ferrumequinum]|uniref:Uncharacterized protein n=1 Tax=Rhinolophus ferrumequinum TaxID=59479 RepID=A0A7J7Y645_RHIFE|nr:hypothetical protein mRhiFer1_010067 [Rhinolophus ferrumequinum]